MKENESIVLNFEGSNSCKTSSITFFLCKIINNILVNSYARYEAPGNNTDSFMIFYLILEKTKKKLFLISEALTLLKLVVEFFLAAE